MTDALAVVREFGFPIIVSLWFMWRLEKRLDKFSSNMDKLLIISNVIAKMFDRMPEEG